TSVTSSTAAATNVVTAASSAAAVSVKTRPIRPSSSFDTSEAEFKPGILLWCKLGNYPFWPAEVTTDPVSGLYVQKSRFGYLTYYVQYLGEKLPIYGWTGAPLRVMPFKGLEEFHRTTSAKIAQETNKTKSRELRDFYALKCISEARKTSWHRAVSIAELRLSQGTKPADAEDIVQAGIANVLSQDHRDGSERDTDGSSVRSSSPSSEGPSVCSSESFDHGHRRSTGSRPGSKWSSSRAKAASQLGPTRKKMRARLKRNLAKLPSHAASHIVGQMSDGSSDTGASSNSFLVSAMTTNASGYPRSVSPSTSDDSATSSYLSASGRLKDENFKKGEGLSKRRRNVEHGQIAKAVCSTCLQAETDNGETLLSCSCGHSFHKSCTSAALNRVAVFNEQLKDKSSKKHPSLNNRVEKPTESTLLKLSKDSHSNDAEYPMRNAVEDGANERCEQCTSPFCCICGIERANEEAIAARCCPRFYHLRCLQQASLYVRLSANKRTIVECPRDTCLTCHASHPGISMKKSGFIRCAKCPATYHRQRSCVPAASTFLTSDLVLCPRHLRTPAKKVNMDWCHVCGETGDLVCCDVCPVCVHPECVNMSGPVGDLRYECPECSDWIFPVFGRVVWAKLANYIWWPACVVHPSDLPEAVRKAKKAGDHMAVYFFGTHNYSWLLLTQVYPFQADDARQSRSKTFKKKTVAWNNNYQKALTEALDALEKWQTEQAKKTAFAGPPKYRHIYVNTVKSESCRVARSRDNDEQVCVCTDRSPCDDVTCLNRVLNVECRSDCPVGERCQNQRFQRRLYKKTTTFLTSDGRGWGLRSDEAIRKGDFVIEYVGEVIDRDEMRLRLERLAVESDRNVYFLTADSKRIIDAGPAGNHSRFINHSCNPNLFAQKWLVRGEPCVGLFAVRDIQSGEELVFDYQMEFEHTVRQECLCGAENCAGFLGISTPTLRSPSPSGSGASSVSCAVSSKKNLGSQRTRKLMSGKKDPANHILAKATQVIAKLKRQSGAEGHDGPTQKVARRGRPPKKS
ncbi:putative histone-lysine N-methyltransferase Mes-4-like, partial [Tropilaelaps mercedesae]